MQIEESFLTTGNKVLCSGCGACSQICSKGAIMMVEDDEGFRYPIIDKNKCISCGLCYKICPYVGNTENNQAGFDPSYYAVTSTNKEAAMESATIGLTTMIAEKILDDKGIIFGVQLDEKQWAANHIACRSKEELDKTKNSKYIQSNTRDTFQEVKSLLDKERTVLYIGTPCQIAGLKSYLRRLYSNLYTIDLVCHGTFSHRLLKREIKYWESKYDGAVSNYRFRSKKKYPWIYGGIVNFDVKRNGVVRHIERNASSSPAYRSYAYSGDGNFYTLRLSCYNCYFRKSERYADLTIGDAWGEILTEHPEYRTQQNLHYGISLVLANTYKGEMLLYKIKNLELKSLKYNVAFSQPALLLTKREIPNKRAFFYNDYNSNFGKRVETVLGCNLDKDFYKFRVKVFIEKIKSFFYECGRIS